MALMVTSERAAAQANVLGFGNQACWQIVDTMKVDLGRRMVHSQFIGFLTGFNMAQMFQTNEYRNLSKITYDYLNEMIFDACYKEPARKFIDVMLHTYRDLPLEKWDQ
jgi:hypothetical protein